MSQFDFGVIDPSVHNGTQLAGFVNSFRDAINSGHSGARRPSYVRSGMLWVDTSAATAWALKLFDGSSDITIASVNPQTHASLADAYSKSDFKSDGSINAPVKYTANGNLVAQNLTLNRQVGEYRALSWCSSGVSRWGLQTDNVPEAGSNAGSDFHLRAYDDGGAALGDVFTIARATRILNFKVSPTAPTPSAGDNSLKLATTAFVQAAMGSVSGMPVGAVLLMPSTNTPEGGFIAGNGAAISRSVYSALDAAMYVGDAENATAPCWYRCTNPASPSTSRSTTGQYFVLPDLRGVFPRFLDDGKGYDPGRAINTYQADEFKSHTHGIYTNSSTSNSGAHFEVRANYNYSLTQTAPTGGAETRPKNFAVRGWIKY